MKLERRNRRHSSFGLQTYLVLLLVSVAVSQHTQNKKKGGMRSPLRRRPSWCCLVIESFCNLDSNAMFFTFCVVLCNGHLMTWLLTSKNVLLCLVFKNHQIITPNPLQNIHITYGCFGWKWQPVAQATGAYGTGCKIRKKVTTMKIII